MPCWMLAQREMTMRSTPQVQPEMFATIYICHTLNKVSEKCICPLGIVNMPLNPTSTEYCSLRIFALFYHFFFLSFDIVLFFFDIEVESWSKSWEYRYICWCCLRRSEECIWAINDENLMKRKIVLEESYNENILYTLYDV